MLIGDEDAAFAGGSYVIVQKYVHDLGAWDALPTEEQELIIGRTKLNDIELPDEAKPPNSHLALNVITGSDGEERQIMRFNMPFGRVGIAEFGTYYIAYARTSELIEQMLTNMFIDDPPGNTDRILDFSTAVTGGLFFVPSGDLLENLAPATAPGPSDDEAPADDPGDGSLGIGGLRGAGSLTAGADESVDRSPAPGRMTGRTGETSIVGSRAPMSDWWMHPHAHWCTGYAAPARRSRSGASTPAGEPRALHPQRVMR